MSAPAPVIEQVTEPEPLFTSDLHLFQMQGVARAVVAKEALAVYSAGIGKTIIAMAQSCLLLEQDEIDTVLIVAEATKIRDWVEDDYPNHTLLDAVLYAGTPPQRAKIRESNPRCLVMSYETMRNDLCTFQPKRRAVKESGPLTEWLMDKRVFIVYDEADRIANRSSKLYLANEYLLGRLRRRAKSKGPVTEAPRVLGLTATPIRVSPVNLFNICRLISPQRVCTVAQFERDYILAKDDYGNPSQFCNISADNMLYPEVTPLAQMLAPIIMRKRKSDADVIEQFPRKVENPWTRVDLLPEHAELVRAIVEAYGREDEEEPDKALYGVLRQICNHPCSILHSESEHGLARQIVKVIGEKGLRAIPSSKEEYLRAWVRHLGPEQGVIFTFYGQSVLPYIADTLTSMKISFTTNHGKMSGREKKAAQDAFKGGDVQLFLSSDAGARGLNLGCGTALLHYEPPQMHALYEQRSDRIHRIDSVHPSITIDTLCARMPDTGGEKFLTPDERNEDRIVQRQEWHEGLLDQDLETDEIEASGMITAQMRRFARR